VEHPEQLSPARGIVIYLHGRIFLEVCTFLRYLTLAKFMKKQSFKNHIRYYTPHHFIFYPIVLAGSVISITYFFKQNELIWLFISGLFFILGALSFMMRQHYALTLQNRIVLQEVYFRYYVLTKNGPGIFEELSLHQILAVRFASDDEFPVLVDKAVKERLSPDEIKKLIKDWKGDYMRV